MYIGLNLGTSSLKALLINPQQHIIDVANHALSVSRPRPGGSEQDPGNWVDAAKVAR